MKGPTFEEVWSRVEKLENSVVPLSRRGSNRIMTVDGSGVRRRTSTGGEGKMPIKSFRVAVQVIGRSGRATRTRILDEIGRWESSGVVAILLATGLYELTDDIPLTIRVREAVT